MIYKSIYRNTGNTRDPITGIQHQFCEAVTNIHEDFINMPHLSDIKLRYFIVIRLRARSHTAKSLIARMGHVPIH